MSHQHREEEIEEPPEVINEEREQSPDHIPLKDEFSSDLSDIDFAELADRHQQAMNSQKSIKFKPKRKKIIKPFSWKKKWVRISNAIADSAPLLVQRWVKVKYDPTEEQLAQVAQDQTRDKRNALEMAQSIMMKQMNQQA